MTKYVHNATSIFIKVERTRFLQTCFAHTFFIVYFGRLSVKDLHKK